MHTGIDSERSHEAAAAAFVDRIKDRSIPDIESIYVFGSTARGEAAGLSSDVDVLVVFASDLDPELEDDVRELAYDIMLEYGPVVEVHTMSAASFTAKLQAGHPFVQRIVADGDRYQGLAGCSSATG